MYPGSANAIKGACPVTAPAKLHRNRQPRCRRRSTSLSQVGVTLIEVPRAPLSVPATRRVPDPFRGRRSALWRGIVQATFWLMSMENPLKYRERSEWVNDKGAP